ncbi:MAG: hypothetical protein HY036_06305 [Nitrospirae bacterium]|nr:hypothetical protein [Nitrospirota bacterium]MBI3352172.1 hypothetical protein [Nitrospirota bacterium]
MSPLSPDKILSLFEEFARIHQRPLQILLVGGLSLYFYGMPDRATMDVDAEVKTGLEDLFHFLKEHHVPADLSENFSGWSVIAMPPGYPERSSIAVQTGLLEIRILAPVDFIIAKLRRFTEIDIQDALFVARKYQISPEAVKQTAESAISHSPKDTALFLFRKNVEEFFRLMKNV